MKNITISILATALVFISVFALNEWKSASQGTLADFAVRETCEKLVADWVTPTLLLQPTSTDGHEIIVGFAFAQHKDKGAPAPTLQFYISPDKTITINCLDYFPNFD